MIKVAFTLCVLITLASCTSNDDIDHEQTRIVSQDHDKSIIDSELSSSENSTVYEYEDSEAILRHVVDGWKAPKSLAKKEESYQFLLNLEKKGDIEFAQQNYGTAWNRYSTASIYYPSPKVLVKAGDAQVLHILNRYETICDCDSNDLPEDIRRKNFQLDYLQYIIRREYGLALDFNRYPKKDYNDEQSLSKEQEQQLISKIECLNQKLDFEGDSADVSIIKPCLD
ncbi:MULTISPECIES: hypothetical protein [Psychrobacter]|uniref:hypothetical protein n=1 Tax=Psychrobacter TaxID=497 RepID=UPI000ED2E706|nr:MULTISPECIES: hypothetical protein [Psychrobacter]MBE8608183.1 hypothetical protein [Pseudomonas lundensis]MCG3810241.1 hypothetical protein [Psychrobacter sp. Ps4]HCI75924.1 hypothetical protein [Psychrobacter sp.]